MKAVQASINSMLEDLSHDIKVTNRTELILAILIILVLAITFLGYCLNWW